MKLCQTILAIPGDHLADISPELATSDAANLLACWTSLWHPSLLTQTREVPRCEAADQLVSQKFGSDTLVLVPTISQVAPWETDGPQKPLFTPPSARRGQIIALLKQRLGPRFLAEEELAREFYAFAFAYLQIEILTRAMCHGPTISRPDLSEAIVDAADAALRHDEETFHRRLADAYDQLVQARNHYYPIDFFLIDFSLVAPTTCGKPFASTCRKGMAGNYLLTGQVLDHLATHEPESLAALQEALASGRASICGGSLGSTSLADFAPEGLLEEMRNGLAKFDTHLAQRPTLFAHFAGPIAPLLPGVLEKLGYTGVLTANFEGKPLPSTTATRATWVGLEGSQLEALHAAPLDMGNATTLLGLSNTISQAMDYDLAATLLLVGWPGHRSEFYDDLLRVAQRSTVLGRIVTLDEYFDVTSSSDYAGTIAADDYPGPSREPTRGPGLADSLAEDSLAKLARLAGLESRSTPPDKQLAQLLGASCDPSSSGLLTFNGSSGERAGVPSFGWRWMPTGKTNRAPPRAEPGLLRNEAMEIFLDDQSGGISSTRLHHLRGNLLSQQLVLSRTELYQIAFDQMEVLTNSPTHGVLASASRIVDTQGTTVAELRQTTTLQRDSQQIEVEVTLTPTQEGQLPFAIASRIAFRDPTATLRRGLQGVLLATSKRSIETDRLQVTGEPVPIVIATDQPRLHHRSGERWIDTTLFKEPSQPMNASLSYGIDSEIPALPRAEQDLVAVAASPPSQPTGWWLRIAARNLQVTRWAVEQQGDQRLLRLRVLETAGRQVKTTLAAWSPFVEARTVDFRGQLEQPLTLHEGTIALHLAAYEWVEIEAVW